MRIKIIWMTLLLAGILMASYAGGVVAFIGSILTFAAGWFYISQP